MGRARSANGGRGELHTGFRKKNLRERDHLEHPGVDGSIILKFIFRKWNGGGDMGWIDLAQNRDRGWAFVYGITTLGFQIQRGISGQSENLLAFLEGLCSMYS